MKPISVLTVFLYFLPFVFCVFSCEGFAYNSTEAAENEAKEAAKNTTTTVSDSIPPEPDSFNNVGIADTAKIPQAIQSDEPLIPENFQETRSGDGFWFNVQKKAVFPTTTSLSGVGCIFYFKNLAGQIFISASILMALAVAVIVWFKKTRRFSKFFILINIACLAFFVVDCFYSDVSVKFGIWLLLVTLILQMRLCTKTIENIVVL